MTKKKLGKKNTFPTRADESPALRILVAVAHEDKLLLPWYSLHFLEISFLNLHWCSIPLCSAYEYVYVYMYVYVKME